MKTNKIIMENARKSLAKNWEVPIATYLVDMIISGIGGCVGLIIIGPMQFGSSFFALNIADHKKINIVQIFEGFRVKFAESIIAFLLTTLYVILWSILLIIPGIIAAIAYSQTFFILVNDRKISAIDAMKKSKKIMEGNKIKYLCLCFRFTGWIIISMLTFGIGFLWLIPYINVSFANFYNDIK